jgi:rapamycin-insensitive companion of mTOR
MSKTELGCQVLSEKGHFAEFSHFIRQHGLESEDPDLILKLKSVLWAVVSCFFFVPHAVIELFLG